MRGYGIREGLEAGLLGCGCAGLVFVVAVAVGEGMGGERRWW